MIIRVMVAVAMTACAVPAAPPVAHPRPRPDDRFTQYPALTATGSKHYVTPGGIMTEAVPWKIGQWVVYKRKDRDGIELDQLRIVSQDACGFWIERTLTSRGRPRTWMFCVRAQPSPDDPNLHESLSAVIERRGKLIVSVEDFRVGSADRTGFSWLVSLVHAPWSGRTDVPREDVATPLGEFHEAAKLTVTEGSGETTRWSHAVVPLGGVVKEVARDHVRVLVAFGRANASAPSPLVEVVSDLELAHRRIYPQPPTWQTAQDSDCLIGIRLSPKICETSPRRFLSVGFGLGGVSRNGDVPPIGFLSWRFQLGQRLRHGLHLVEELNSVASGETSWTPSVTSEHHGSFGAGIRWTPFAPRLQRSFFTFLLPQRYVDFRAFYVTAVVGANVRDRVTRMTSTQSSEDVAWSPMASLAVGLFEIQGQDWSFGPEFREQIAIYDGRLQRGWQLMFPIHLNGW